MERAIGCETGLTREGKRVGRDGKEAERKRERCKNGDVSR